MSVPTITKAELTEALEKWEAEASAANWPNRTDPERFADNADYIFRLCGKATSPRDLTAEEAALPTLGDALADQGRPE